MRRELNGAPLRQFLALPEVSRVDDETRRIEENHPRDLTTEKDLAIEEDKGRRW
jgi:hypothetical protein